MKAIEFQAQVKKGKIEISPQFAERISGQVRVIVWIEETSTTPDNFIEHLLEHPVPVKHLHPLSREEIYVLLGQSHRCSRLKRSGSCLVF